MSVIAQQHEEGIPVMDGEMQISTGIMSSRIRVEEITKNTPNLSSWALSPSFSFETPTISYAEKHPPSSPRTCGL